MTRFMTILAVTLLICSLTLTAKEPQSDVPSEGDVMTVVHTDIRQSVMIDETKGIDIQGDIRTALVVFAFNPSIPMDIPVGAVAESGRVSIDCLGGTYKMVSDLVIDKDIKVIKTLDISNKTWAPIKEGTIVDAIAGKVCQGVSL